MHICPNLWLFSSNFIFWTLCEDDAKHFYVILGNLLNLPIVMLPSGTEVPRFPYLKLLQIRGRLSNSYCNGCQHEERGQWACSNHTESSKVWRLESHNLGGRDRQTMYKSKQKPRSNAEKDKSTQPQVQRSSSRADIGVFAMAMEDGAGVNKALMQQEMLTALQKAHSMFKWRLVFCKLPSVF